MRCVASLGALALGACQLTTPIGSAGNTGSGDGSGSASTESSGSTGATTGSAASTAGGSGPGTTSGATTDATGGSATLTSDSMGSGPGEPCAWHQNPMECFSHGCVWSFPLDECLDEGGGGTGFDPPPACMPNMQDNPCVDCLKAGCCQALVACDQDPDCSCFLGCLQQNNPVLQCQGICQPSDGAAYLSMCAGNACFPVCG